ncbi:MAG: type II/IV secretion system protein [Opitutaceae bacterium]|nr:type II/IV secretion system protein [Opitutaceae bacterium]
MPSSRANSEFVELLLRRPGFDSGVKLEVLAAKHQAPLDLLQVVIDQKLLLKEDVCRLWGDHLGIAYVDVLASGITEEAIKQIPIEIARKVRAIGLYVIDGVLTVAMATPEDANLVRRVEQIAKIPLSPVFCLPCEIDDAISVLYSTERSITESLAELEQSALFSDPELSVDRLSELAQTETLVHVLDEIIYFALRERATDIHIEPQEIHSRIRFRIDGTLREILNFPRKLHGAVVSRLKILSNLNISETRFPQDGRFFIPMGTNRANFRLSVIPTIHGEKTVVRVLTSATRRMMITLDSMLMSQRILQPFRRLIQSPSGIIFATGPTGSGKTTTLYAAIDEINSTKINIATIEDPVEIPMPGVIQSQINPKIDLKFSSMLRAFLRQDPDVILIGEIRDTETAKIATLHTNTAPQAIVRLMEIGVEPYMVAPSVIGVLSQGLAARICDKCKEAYYPPREVLLKYFKDDGLTDVPFFRGHGCPHCRNTGYRGRVAFHELVLITEEIRQMISESRSVQEISRAAAKVGYRPLRYDGLKKVLLGLTTIEQIEENCSFEWVG